MLLLRRPENVKFFLFVCLSPPAAVLAGALGLHTVAVSLIALPARLAQTQTPAAPVVPLMDAQKLDTFSTYSFLLFNRYRLVNGALVISEVNVMLGERFVVTVHGWGGEEGALGNIEDRIQRAMPSVEQGPAVLMHAMLDLVVDGQFEVIEALQERADTDSFTLHAGITPHPRLPTIADIRHTHASSDRPSRRRDLRVASPQAGVGSQPVPDWIIHKSSAIARLRVERSVEDDPVRL